MAETTRARPLSRMPKRQATAPIRSLFDRFNAGDLDGTATLVTHDCELVDMAQGRTYYGPAGVREWLGAFRTALPDAHAELVEVLADGGRVATEHVGTGTHTGPLATPSGEIPPTGRRIELRFSEMYEIRDGRIARVRVWYDSATMMRQLGLLPEPEGRADRAMTTAMALGVRARRRLGRP
jgi:steroid delta-isomerase-like uncharacterized protein